MSEFTIDFQKKDVDHFVKQINRLQSELGRSNRAANAQAMRQVLSSLAASTKVSEPYRNHKFIGVSRSGKNLIYEVDTKYTTPKRKGKALRRSWQGDWRKQLIYVESKSDLYERPALIIAMQGVAKESWIQAGKFGRLEIKSDMKLGARQQKNKRIMRKAARRWVKYESKYNDLFQYVKVSNNIRHIVEAIKGGKQEVNTAMERAGRGLEKAIERELARRAKAV